MGCGRADPKQDKSRGLLGGQVIPLVTDARPSSDKSIAVARNAARKRPYTEEKVDCDLVGEGQINGAARACGAAVFISARDQFVRY